VPGRVKRGRAQGLDGRRIDALELVGCRAGRTLRAARSRPADVLRYE